MNIQCSTGKELTNNEGLINLTISMIQEEFSWIKDRVTRVNVHLSTDSGNSLNGKDTCCILQARLKGLQSFAVAEHSSNIEQAMIGAIDRLKSTIKVYLWKTRNYAYKNASTKTGSVKSVL